jgi:transposase
MIDSVVGIDVSKSTFDAVLLAEQGWTRHRSFSNNAQGFSAMLEWLQGQACWPVQACMEATGNYWLALASHLHEAGGKVSVVNPACIKAFGDSELTRSKTDKVDAGIIARFCVAMKPGLWEPAAEELVALQGQVRRLESVQRMYRQEQNRLAVPGIPDAVRASLQRMAQLLEQEMELLCQQMREHVEAHAELKRQHELLTSIPGIGERAANVVLGGTCGTALSSARQLAAYAGLVPQHRTSGSSVRGRPRLSKRGNARLRRSLYWPAIVAMKHNPVLRACAQRLRAKGKPGKVIIAALMRRLLHQSFGVLHHGIPFDPDYQPTRP